MSDSLTSGALLQALRKKSRLSIADISAATMIPSPVIAALESDDIDGAGGMAYARGHLRVVAQTLGVDATELLELLSQSEVDSRPMIELLEENNATPLNPSKKSLSPKYFSMAASLILGVAILVPSGMALASKSSHKPAAKVSIAKSATSSKKSQSAQVLQSPTVSSSDSRQVVVTARDGATWLSVTDVNGTFLFSGMLHAGESKSFPYSAVSWMRIGNAGVTSIVADGEDLGSLGANGEAKTITLSAAATATQG